MNARVVLRVNAGVVLALGLSLLVPLALSLLYRDGSWESFLLPAAGMVAVGTGGIPATRFPGPSATSPTGTCISPSPWHGRSARSWAGCRS